MKQWTALCQTCSWAGVRCAEETNPKQEKNNHLKRHPEHKVSIFVTGEERSEISSASLYDTLRYPSLPIKLAFKRDELTRS